MSATTSIQLERIDSLNGKIASPAPLVPAANRSQASLSRGLTQHYLPVLPKGPTQRFETAGVDLSGSPSTPNKDYVLRSRVQFIALCWDLFLAGWNDGTTGPLLPKIQEFYGVGLAVVSLVFIIACVGFCAGALSNVYLTNHLGFGKTIVLGCMLQGIAYAIQAPALPFPVFVLAFGINGFGLAIQDAQANGFVASLKNNAEAKMGLLHAAYGLGAFCSPLVATQFADMDNWSYHYIASLGIAISNVAVLSFVFRFKGQDECLQQIGEAPTGGAEEEHSQLKQILSLKTVHFLALFVFIYVGVEVTIGGWIVTYIQRVRGGGHSAGYISSGFFGGLTVGRVLLLWVNKKVGERRVLFLYTAVAIALELVVWLVPSLIGGAVAVSLVGLLLGPFYPIAMNHASRVLPRWLLTGSIGWIAGFGQAGTAVLPFMTGAMASKFGITTLHPLLIAMMTTMMVMWALVPNPRRRD